MRPDDLRALLRRVRRGTVSPAHAARDIIEAPFERLEFATLDHQRALRVGFPEVVFGHGKTPGELVAITSRLARRHGVVLATRVDDAGRAALVAAHPNAEVYVRARAVVLRGGANGRTPRLSRPRGQVLVLCAGTADLPVAEEAALTAELMGSQVARLSDVGVAGLHRLLDNLPTLQQARVIVVVAGMEAALTGVVAGLVAAPVVAVPTSVGYGASFEGLAALLGMLNSCAPGVAVVNIDNGFGAGYLAAQINRREQSDGV
jgi:hypothetical protein